MKDVLIAILFFLLIYSWVSTLSWGAEQDSHLLEEARVEARTKAYLQAWSKRAPLDSMRQFFAAEHCLNDFGESCALCDFEEIRRQLHWRAQPLGLQKKLLKVEEIIASPQNAVVKGSLLPHRWYEQRYESSQKFILWVKYDTSLQIVEQNWAINR